MDTPTQEELREKTRLEIEQVDKEIEEEDAEEKTWQEEDKRCCSYEQYKAAVKEYIIKKDFKPSLLCKCACPEGSISIIAARPAGGKTSSMINIVRETLMLNANTEAANGRKILYVNLEMNFRQILDNLHLSCIYDFATEEERERLSQLKKTKAALFYTAEGLDWKDKNWVINADRQEVSNMLKPVSGDLKQIFETNYSKAEGLIKNAMNSNIFKIYDGIGLGLEDVINKIGKSPKGTLILIDYMQRLPAPERFHTAQRYLQIQKSSAQLLKIAIEKQLIVIAGAQLKREGNSNETSPSMESIRESGDIEQDAHNVVILNNDYIKVVKAREGCEASQRMTVNTVKQFVFWKTREKHEPNQVVEKQSLKNPWN
jgi:replicative DNA helicase